MELESIFAMLEEAKKQLEESKKQALKESNEIEEVTKKFKELSEHANEDAKEYALTIAKVLQKQTAKNFGERFNKSVFLSHNLNVISLGMLIFLQALAESLDEDPQHILDLFYEALRLNSKYINEED